MAKIANRQMEALKRLQESAAVEATPVKAPAVPKPMQGRRSAVAEKTSPQPRRSKRAQVQSATAEVGPVMEQLSAQDRKLVLKEAGLDPDSASDADVGLPKRGPKSYAGQKVLDIQLLTLDDEQPRQTFRTGNPVPQASKARLEKLMESISMWGILEPLIVYREGALYKILVGERRYRAALALGLSEVPVVVQELPRSAAERWAIQVSENFHRDDLSPAEKAATAKEIHAATGGIVGRTARLLCMSRMNTWRLLNASAEGKPRRSKNDKRLSISGLVVELEHQKARVEAREIQGDQLKALRDSCANLLETLDRTPA
ncbi:MAG: ParB/RepB/Spo0J family partition protein [Candidatus Dormibacteria bacterium]